MTEIRNTTHYKPSRLLIVELVSEQMESSIVYSLLCKIIRAAIMLSYSIRRDTSVCISINPIKVSLLGHGILIRGLHVDEPSCTGFLKKFFTKNIGIGFEFTDNCLSYAQSLGLQELDFKPLLYNSIESLKSFGEIHRGGVYIRFVCDGYGNTEVGLKIWNLLSIVNIVLDNIQHSS